MTSGTAKECAEFLGEKNTSVYALKSKYYLKKIESKKKNGKDRNTLLAICIGKAGEEF